VVLLRAAWLDCRAFTGGQRVHDALLLVLRCPELLALPVITGRGGSKVGRMPGRVIS
jgi:hypothetical protein